MKTLLILLLSCVAVSAQVPSFRSFDTNYFTTNGFIIRPLNLWNNVASIATLTNTMQGAEISHNVANGDDDDVYFDIFSTVDGTFNDFSDIFMIVNTNSTQISLTTDAGGILKSSLRLNSGDGSGFIELKTNGTNEFYVANGSGYTGAGTLFLSDDGTYKAGGTTINPTDNRIPYRSSSTTFGDSPWHYIAGNTNALGFNSTNFFLKNLPTIYVVGLGDMALASVTSGAQNTALGWEALRSLTDGSENTAVGMEAMRDANGSASVGIGNGVLYSATGTGNTAVGSSASSASTSAIHNTALGYVASQLTTTGSYNTAIGAFSGRSNLLGQYNVFIGHTSGGYSTNLERAVIIGAIAGTNYVSQTNTIAIGYGVDLRGNNTAQIGTNGVSVLYLNGTVGWFRGTGTPEAAVTAPIGSFFSREDGGAATSFYVKESGTGNTGWVGK